MQKIDFKSDDGNITCTLVIKNNIIPKDKIEPIFRSLILHLEMSIGTYPNSYIFNSITKMRGDFYSKVLQFLVDENLDKGQTVPPHILSHLTKGRERPNWDCYDD